MTYTEILSQMEELITPELKSKDPTLYQALSLAFKAIHQLNQLATLIDTMLNQRNNVK